MAIQAPQAHPNLTFMMRLTLEAYKLITDELWCSEDGSQPLFYLCRPYLFRQVTIIFRSEGWTTYTEDQTQYCDEHAISFYTYLAPPDPAQYLAVRLFARTDF